GRALIGVCGGMQMLGNTIHDPDGIESDKAMVEGLGVLDLDTRFIGEKLTTRTEGRIVGERGLLSGALGMSVSGYEIHVGVTESDEGASRAMETADGSAALGYADRTGRVLGTYVHDLFKNKAFADSIVGNVARMKGLKQPDESEPFSQEAEFDKLAAYLRKHLDMKAVYGAMGLSS
ncbi:MAG: cobyric acid synthase CobQ, partial [Dehalococcoidia bacterium]|nr:cobyric acid synthase CobQ [Dehalococcoidia bacterium]